MARTRASRRLCEHSTTELPSHPVISPTTFHLNPTQFTHTFPNLEAFTSGLIFYTLTSVIHSSSYLFLFINMTWDYDLGVVKVTHVNRSVSLNDFKHIHFEEHIHYLDSI